MAASRASTSTSTSRLIVSLYALSVFITGLLFQPTNVSRVKYSLCIKTPFAPDGDVRFCVLFYTGSKPEEECMKVNDRVTVKTDGGPRRPGVVLAIEEFSEGTMYLVSLEDYPLGIWFFNELGHPDGIFVEKAE
ncbi:protein DsrB [Enterobacter cloacae]|nr:protein DsrB [Enterobacter cloacae]